jgi:N,N'-diacetyllegionaminate synthase
VSLFLYAETAFHHEGDYAYLKSLVDMAAETGCQGVKFQVLIDLDDLMSSLHANYQNAKKWLLRQNQWSNILEYANSKHLKIVAMPCDVAAVSMIEKLSFSIEFYDIHSVSFYDHKLLETIKCTGKPVILGVGGRTLEEMATSKEFFGDQLAVFMVGFQAFPSDLRHTRIGMIPFLKNLFPDCTIGYADHTDFRDEWGVKSFEYAYLLGARVFEKHLTCNEGVARVDYEAAVGYDKMVTIREKLLFLDELIGHGPNELFSLSEKEVAYRNRQKVLVAARPIMAGEGMSVANTRLKMANGSEAYTEVKELEGAVATCDILVDEPITKERVALHDKK